MRNREDILEVWYHLVYQQCKDQTKSIIQEALLKDTIGEARDWLSSLRPNYRVLYNGDDKDVRETIYNLQAYVIEQARKEFDQKIEKARINGPID